MSTRRQHPRPGSIPHFCLLARPYRWLEYLSFGHALERCRFTFLHTMAGQKRALVLGDGDGRFTAQLLAQSPDSRVHAVDCSAGMLAALYRRAKKVNATDRLTLEQADLREWNVPRSASLNPPFDLITTHFFLDCLTTAEVARLAQRVSALSGPGAFWTISEFAVPSGSWMRPVAAAVVFVLYRVFRLLTALGPQQLPDHASALQSAGWRRVQRCEYLRGLLMSELWQQSAATPAGTENAITQPS